MHIHVDAHPEVCGAGALSECIRGHSENPILLLVSGGSAFLLLEGIDETVLGGHITLGVLDERYSLDAKVNNFLQLTETSFFKKAIGRGVTPIDTSVSLDESRAMFAQRFEDALRTWVCTNPNGVVIVTMGIGEDGHTAGIMPMVEGVDFEDDAWVREYTVDAVVNRYTERVTTTHTFLREAVDYAFVFVQGESKKDAYRAIVDEKGTLSETPARIIREVPHTQIFTDIVYP